jgi:hypothetical protein
MNTNILGGTIRELCVQIVRTRGADFEIVVLELQSAIDAHFRALSKATPFAELLHAAQRKPPDA